MFWHGVLQKIIWSIARRGWITLQLIHKIQVYDVVQFQASIKSIVPKGTTELKTSIKMLES